jgi:DNA-binding GntR family transcriptional regulator
VVVEVARMAANGPNGSSPPAALLAVQTYERLKAAILRSELPPGTALSVPELARQLDVSRSPVREAVQRLINDGLATSVPHHSAVVSGVDLDDLRELYIVRESLEGLAARLATERLDADGLALLEAILAEHEAALGSGADNATHIELDMRFHRVVRELADNCHLTATLEPLAGRSHLALHGLWRSADAPRLALDEHRRVVECMAAGDPALAEEAARRHIARLSVRLGHATVREADRTGRRSRTKAQLAPDRRRGRSA